jgi:hypothetical protein
MRGRGRGSLGPATTFIRPLDQKSVLSFKSS